MNEKYFDHWADAIGLHYNFKNIFVSQENLSKKVNGLEYAHINPLTIRLCLLQEPFKALFDMRLAVRQRTSNLGYAYHEAQNHVVSGVRSSLIVNPVILSDPFYLNLHQVYKNFYALSSFFCSILDRLAYEVHLMNDVGGDEISWREFRTNPGLLKKITSKNQTLATVLATSNFSEMLKLRDSFEHGKHMEINATKLDSDFDFIIKNGSEVRIVDFCQAQIIKLLQTCEEIYRASP